MRNKILFSAMFLFVACMARGQVSNPSLPGGGTAGTVPYNLTETPSGGVQGSAAWTLPGVPGRTVTGTTDSITQADRGSVVTYNSGSAVAVTLTSAATLGSNFFFAAYNPGTGTATFTPGAGTINGNAALAVSTGQSCAISSSDNVNYIALCSSSGAGATPCTSTANAIQKNSSGSFGCSLATDDGTTFTYPGSGGFVATNGGGIASFIPSSSGAVISSNGVVYLYGANLDGGAYFQTSTHNLLLSGNYDGNSGLGTTITIKGGAYPNTQPAGDVILLGGADSGGTNGKVRLQTTGAADILTVGDKGAQFGSLAAPTCDSTTRGTLNYIAGGVGVKDIVQICTKDASNVYAWRSIY